MVQRYCYPLDLSSLSKRFQLTFDLVSELFYLYNDRNYYRVQQERLKKDAKKVLKEVVFVLGEQPNENESIRLASLIKAIQLKLDDIQLVIQSKEAFKLERNSHKKVIVFGLNAKQLGFHFEEKAYSIQDVGGVQFLFSHELQALDDRQLATHLWKQLRILFGL